MEVVVVLPLARGKPRQAQQSFRLRNNALCVHVCLFAGRAAIIGAAIIGAAISRVSDKQGV
jgi:hypothetical protein